MTELVPTGKLRFGVVSAPEQTSFFVVTDAAGDPRGVTVDLARELARRAGAPIEFMVAPNSGEITDALSSGPIAAGLPGTRILDGAFHQIEIAIAVPKNRPNALAYVSAYLEEAKATGIVRKAFDGAGLKGLPVAAPAARK